MTFATGPATPVPPPEDPTAVVGPRFLAAVVDIGILWVFTLPYWLVMSQTYDGPERPFVDGVGGVDACTGRGWCTNVNDRYVEGGPMIVLTLVWVAYMVGVFVLQRGLTGRTIGTMLTGLVVVGPDGRPLGIGRALLRSVAGIVDYVPCCVPLVGIVTTATTKGHRRVGDLAASSYVVRAEGLGHPVALPGPALPYATPAPMPSGYPAQPPTPPSAVPPVAPPTPPQPPTPSPAVAPGAQAGPVWDAERGAYIQWDPSRQQWLQFDQASQQWKQYDPSTGRWDPVDG